MSYVKLITLSVFAVLLFAFTKKEHKLKGTVYGSQNQPIAGAIIQEKGTSNAVSTDPNGKFTITVSSTNVTIIATAAGYQQKEVKVGNSTVLTIKLNAVRSLDEVVVVGYGTRSKQTVTGAATIIGSTNNRTVYPSPSFNSSGGLLEYKKDFDREGYDHIQENTFHKVKDNPLSTFSIDVDGASYSNIRRFINNGQLPPAGAVRIEEMINYFSYQYPQPEDDAPFSINTEYAVCPWNTRHQLVSIGLQGKKIATENLPPSNLVFLVDVSGSMMSEDKLPLVQASMKLLVDQLRKQDKVAIVVYAGRAGLVLPSTNGQDKFKIKNAIDGLQAGGSTAGGEGIKLAYKVASENFIKEGNNRVVLCTDGDFNVGVSSDDELERMIETKRETGVYLSVLGYGTGNYQDAKMQKLANKGNGNHAYIDDLKEARKVLIQQFGGTMFTIAKDVKLQIEFNPAKVQGYRLIGYENRMLAKEDFNDDKKDAGEMGSGHTVTALYELIPTGIEASELRKVDDLKYQKPLANASGFKNNEDVMTVKFRYKKPNGDKSLLLQQVVKGSPRNFKTASANLHLAAAVAQFGMLLRNSDFKGEGGYILARKLMSSALGYNTDEQKMELVQLMKMAEAMRPMSQNEDNVMSKRESRRFQTLSRR
ncbi:MAG TPA: von Willebrand factor type A domain-containing protein [Niabella sp.]|nr:von Willebrand factor type A domain-containing protein [Niabella sp.]HQW15007.1 von Willebrand factor type A domain-containing protein [Niabella sp.]HQX20101.1 von Willebrand factor type A domain-containing protein [Niabella sp.]HQX40387.1 von Willebrand factor type A domain-containing protein [Niabella sp.]HRB06706.1 von Willebrand factor type A domain-containing protein [Niabella sp.]